MINREDMLELTRRMTLSRTSFTRIAGAYMDADGDIDGSFNTSFLKLSSGERQKHLNIAKTIPFSETNVNLKDHKIKAFSPKAFSSKSPQSGSQIASQTRGHVLQLLNGLKSCGLKNDALMDTFYDVIAANYRSSTDYGIFLYHDSYDVPVKASDKERLGESEEVFSYLICAVCPLEGDYEPQAPQWGFLFPMFRDRSTDQHYAAVFNSNPLAPHKEMDDFFLW